MFRTAKGKDSNSVHGLDTRSTNLHMTNCPPKWAWSRSCAVLKVWQKVLIYRKRYEIGICFQWKTNRKSYGLSIVSNGTNGSDLSWMTLKVIHRLLGFLDAIPWPFVQHFTRFQLTACSRGPSVIAGCLVFVWYTLYIRCLEKKWNVIGLCDWHWVIFFVRKFVCTYWWHLVCYAVNVRNNTCKL